MEFSNYSPIEFEKLCCRVLEGMGLTTKTTKATGDGGIDIVATSTMPIVSGIYIVQCKRYKGTVGEPVIRDLYGVVMAERANKGIIITSGSFTKSAREFAKNKQIELIDGIRFEELIEEYGLHLDKDKKIAEIKERKDSYIKSVNEASCLIADLLHFYKEQYIEYEIAYQNNPSVELCSHMISILWKNLRQQGFIYKYKLTEQANKILIEKLKEYFFSIKQMKLTEGQKCVVAALEGSLYLYLFEIDKAIDLFFYCVNSNVLKQKELINYWLGNDKFKILIGKNLYFIFEMLNLQNLKEYSYYICEDAILRMSDSLKTTINDLLTDEELKVPFEETKDIREELEETIDWDRNPVFSLVEGFYSEYNRDNPRSIINKVYVNKDGMEKIICSCDEIRMDINHSKQLATIYDGSIPDNRFLKMLEIDIKKMQDVYRNRIMKKNTYLLDKIQ